MPADCRRARAAASVQQSISSKTSTPGASRSSCKKSVLPLRISVTRRMRIAVAIAWLYLKKRVLAHARARYTAAADEENGAVQFPRSNSSNAGGGCNDHARAKERCAALAKRSHRGPIHF